MTATTHDTRRTAGGKTALLLLSAVLLAAVGCSGSSPTGDGTDGSVAAGGTVGSGGTIASGSGGALGGSSVQGAGGTPGSGGARDGTGGSDRSGGGGETGGVGEAGAGGEGGGANGGGAASGRGGATVTGGAGGVVQELVHFYGRWDVRSDRAITVNSGSHLGATFMGTAITARFDVSVNTPSSMPTLAWQIDQEEWKEADLAAAVSLRTGLASGTHTVTLMARSMDENQSRWTPPLTSSTTFLGFTVTGGAVQSSVRPVRPKMEFLGDSITEGVNVWQSHNGQTSKGWKDDGRIAYASQTAQMLGAEWRQVGFGYLGILKTGNGGVPKANDSFNWIYKDVPRDDWQADMVVINEGTNDSGASEATFRAGYAQYLTTIRLAYPNAKLLAMRPFGGSQAAAIKAEVDARNAAGDTRVFYVDTTGWLLSTDFTDGVHPNDQGSGKAAQALVDAINKVKLP